MLAGEKGVKMEHRQNWHRFQRVLGYLPPKKTGLMVLHSNQRILAGAVGVPADSPSQPGFSDIGMSFDHVESAWEVLSHKYGAAGATFLGREELIGALSQVAAVKSNSPATDHFPAQVAKLREMLGLEKGEKRTEKSKLAVHLGDKPFEQFWPRKPFFLSFFRSIFGELFPERKLFLLAVVNDAESIDSLLLEFHGPELKGFCDPDFSGLDWKGKDHFLRENSKRFVSWCESRYMLPTYALFVSRRAWDECRDVQQKNGDKLAWKNLLKIKNMRDVEKEVLFDPEPWPIKAILRWHSMRG